MKRFFENDNVSQRRFLLILFVISLYCFPIIHANIYYVDDYFRSETGHISMASAGRFLSSIFFLAVNLKSNITDIAPLTQIASAIILSCALYFLSFYWKLNEFSSIIILPLIVCSPFFCENISYRFDSIVMALALSCVIFSFCLKGKLSIKKYYLLRIFLVFSSLCLYQAAFTAVIIISIFDATLLMKEESVKNSLNTFVNNIFYAFCAVVFYKIIYMLSALFLPRSRYSIEHSAGAPDLETVFHNFKRFSRVTLKEFGTHGGGLEIGLGLIVIFSIIFFLAAYIKEKEYSKAIISLVLITLAGCSLGGLMVFLASPIISMRVMMGSGPFLCGIMLLLVGRRPVFIGFQRVLLIISTWVLFVQIITPYEWSNAVKSQDELNEYIAANLIQDLYSTTDGGLTFVRFNTSHEGWVQKHNAFKLDDISDLPQAPMAKLVWKNRPVLFDDEPVLTAWIYPKLLMNKKTVPDNILYFSSDNNDSRFTQDEGRGIMEKCIYDKKLIRPYYFLYIKGHSVIVDFHKSCSGTRTY